MTDNHSRPRRMLIRAAAAVLCPLVLVALAAIAAASPAAAICHGDQCGGDPTWTWTSVLVVQPHDGTVTIDSSRTCDGSNPATCTVTDTIVTDQDVRPESGWPTHTLDWQGRPGFTPSWTGPCTVSGARCIVINDQDDATVQVTGYDQQPPTITALNVPARSAAGLTHFTVQATDNDQVTQYAWHVCNTSQCADVTWGYNNVYLGTSWPADTYTISVRAIDASGNWSTQATKSTVVVPPLQLSASTQPGTTDATTIAFSTNEDDHIVSRQCRAYQTGSTAPAFGACTTAATYAPALADGNWTIDIQVTDDVGQQASVTRTFVLDTAAPTLALTDGPSEGGQVTTSAVSFSFASSDANPAGFRCAVDARDPEPCTNPFTVTGLGNGEHQVSITADDAAGHSTTVVRHFSVSVGTTMIPKPARVVSRYGMSAGLAVTITPATATGLVRFTTTHGRRLCTATVADGEAACYAPASLAVGRYQVLAKYTGDYTSSTTRLTLVVRA